MKKKIGKVLSCLTMLAVAVSPATAYVANAKTEGEIRAEYIEAITNNLEVFSRYDEVTRLSLYKSAMKAIMEKNPELYDDVLHAMLKSVDENSEYYTAEETKKLLEKLNGEVTGIGVNVLSGDGNIIVSRPIPGSPAEKAGIKAGDIIIAADGKDLRGMNFDTALEYVRGPVGTKVEVSILRGGAVEPIKITVERTNVVSDPTDYELKEHNGKKIAVITLYSFTDTALEHFKAALKKAEQDGTDNVLIDLRDNGGGYLDQAVGIADLFLEKDKIITTEEHKGDALTRTYKATGKGKKYNTVILINGMSASASEVLTAALKENGSAKVVGEKSFGKGTVQTMANLPDGALMKYTTAYYLTPLGNNIHKKGITPDITVENTQKPVDMSEFDTFSLQKKYTVGDRGADIENAKKILGGMGFFVGETNEVFDENLKIAVAAFQKAQGLFSYGVLDITTQYNMYEKLRVMNVEVDDQMTAALNVF